MSSWRKKPHPVYREHEFYYPTPERDAVEEKKVARYLMSLNTGNGIILTDRDKGTVDQVYFFDLKYDQN